MLTSLRWFRLLRALCLLCVLGTLVVPVRAAFAADASLDVRDFASLQAAVNALPETGGTIVVPSGETVLHAGLRISKRNVTLRGIGHGSVIRPEQPNQFDLITVAANNFRMYNLTLDGIAATPDSLGTCCLVMNGLGVLDPTAVTAIDLHGYLENCLIMRAPRCGLYLRNLVELSVLNCEIIFNQGHGAWIEGLTGTPGAARLQFIGCAFSANGGRGVVARQVSGLTFIGCGFAGNKGGAGWRQGNGLDAQFCLKLDLLSCNFEDAAASTSTTTTENFAYLASCHTATVDNCLFIGDDIAGTNHRAKRGLLMDNCPWSRVTNCVGSKLTVEFVACGGDNEHMVEFGNRDMDAGPDGQARMRLGRGVTSLSRGSLGLPALADQSRRPPAAKTKAGSLIWIESPAAGNSQLQVFDGTSWRNVALGTKAN